MLNSAYLWEIVTTILLIYTLIEYSRTRQPSFLSWSIANGFMLVWLFDERNIFIAIGLVGIALTIILQFRYERLPRRR